MTVEESAARTEAAAGSAGAGVTPPSETAPAIEAKHQEGEKAEAARVLIVSTPVQDGLLKESLGQEAYSYHFVYRAYKPLLEKWARVVEVRRPESQVNYQFYKARRRGTPAHHLAFFPPHLMYVASGGPTIGVVAWEFSTVPDCGFANNLRNNWIQVLNQLPMIVTLCEFTKQTLAASGVHAPIFVLQPPVGEPYFSVPGWTAGNTAQLSCRAFELTGQGTPSAPPADPGGAEGGVPPGFGDPTPQQTRRQKMRAFYHRGKKIYYAAVHPLMPPLCNRVALKLAHLMKDRVRGDQLLPETAAATPVAQLKLSGIVYTTILSTFDRRKNWTDILTAFLTAFIDREDVTLVMKLVAPTNLMEQSLKGVAAYYESLGIRHRCRVVVIGDYLSQEQMLELTRATTFYVNASRAEGLCMPLQDYLAAGRPAVAPRHTAMLDYFDGGVGFVVGSGIEPTTWPHDPRGFMTTTWQRIDWQSLHDQLVASYEMVMRRPEAYRKLSAEARRRMAGYAGTAAVEPRVREVLEAMAKIKWQGES